MEGRSLLPAFDGKPIEREAIYWEHEGNRAVREGKWKLVAKGPGGAWELYDMDADRTEMHDLASSEPDRTREMISKWEAWAKRAHVIPWIWKPQYGQPAAADAPAASEKFKPSFELKQGDDLAKAQAPQVVGRAITIDAEIVKASPNGVIVAQGGVAQGYSLYMKDGRAVLAVRRNGQLTVVAAPDGLPAPMVHLVAVLGKDGGMTLSINDVTVATGKAAGTLTKMPADGLQVGQDTKGAVGEYEAPFPFGGEIGKVSIRLSED